jgi:hypothetical protein
VCSRFGYLPLLTRTYVCSELDSPLSSFASSSVFTSTSHCERSRAGPRGDRAERPHRASTFFLGGGAPETKEKTSFLCEYCSEN